MPGAGRLGRKRLDTRLDPVRWRRPGRGTLFRSAAVAGLLATAAMIAWSGGDTPDAAACAPGPLGTATGSGSTARTADAGPDARTADAGPDARTADAGPDASTADASTAGSGPGAGAAGHRDGGRPAVPAGSVGVPIRLAEPTALTLVRPGDRVDLMRVADAGGDPMAIAGSALVLSITNANDPATGGLLLALKPAEAALAVATAGQGFAVLIRPD